MTTIPSMCPSRTHFPPLFQAIQLGRLELANRIVVPPMVQLRPITAPEGRKWYRRLARGGASLVIVEATGVPRFGADLTVESLKPLVAAINGCEGSAEKRVAAAIQLFPVEFGRKISPDELSMAEIETMIVQYGAAARICRDAGFDGVEVHGAHGYVLNQFLMTDKNHRTDAYGGPLDNRCRLAVQIVETIKRAVGDDLLLLYRQTPTAPGYTLVESLALCQRLIEAGVDVLDISPARNVVPGDLAAPFKRLRVPVIAVGGMEDPAAAAEAVAEGRCDMVAVGRQLIADAKWPQKVKAGQVDDIRKCEKCNVGCRDHFQAGLPIECAFWSEDELEEFAEK